MNSGKAVFDEVTLVSDPGREDEYLKIVLQQYDLKILKAAYFLNTTDGLNSTKNPFKFYRFDLKNKLQRVYCRRSSPEIKVY